MPGVNERGQDPIIIPLDNVGPAEGGVPPIGRIEGAPNVGRPLFPPPPAAGQQEARA